MSRRQLEFKDLNEVIDDIRSLRQSGYERGGNWSLGQICEHLAFFFRGSMDGFGIKYPWIVRATLGKYALRHIFKTGKFLSGVKSPKRFLPADASEDAAAADELSRLIERFQEKAPPLEASPIFGPLSKEDWTRLHLIHCAHHLSFLVPRG